ncbi:Rdx family protein [Bacillus sp. AK128]
MSSLELVPTGRGAFEVIVNDEKIYSKLDVGVFPKTSEIIELLSK